MTRSLAPHQLALFDPLAASVVAYRAAAPRRPSPTRSEETALYDPSPLPASLLRECPASEKPRERLLTAGAAALSEAELVAILIDTRASGASTLEAARDLLDQHGRLSALPSLGPRMLAASGLTPTQAARLLAACELACRLGREAVAGRSAMARPAELASYLHLRFALRDQEVFGAVFLDARSRLVTARELYRGTLARTSVEPREILKLAILSGSAAVVLFHTHPSGDPSPSPDDLAFTRRFHQASEVIGVNLLDHLILGGGGRWCSLKERGVC